MNAKARTARQTIKNRRTAALDAKRSHTLASHARRAGLDASTASGVSGALRSKAKTCGITGQAARLFRRNEARQKMWRNPVTGARRFTRQEVGTLASLYSPRIERFTTARTAILTYAGI